MRPKNYTSPLANQDHIYNSQMGIQIWFHICKWRIFLFKTHLHSGLTRINPKRIRIWLKWAKECLNVMRVWEPSCISQMGIKKLFYIFKPIIPLLPNRLHSKLVKLGARMTRSWEKGPNNYTSSLAIKTTCTTLKCVSKYDLIFANEEFWLLKITFIQGKPESTIKRYEFDRNGKKNSSTLRALGNPLASLKWKSKNCFVFLNPWFHFFQIGFARSW